MADPNAQAETQLKNIEEATGTTASGFAVMVAEAGLDKHGKIVAYLKAEHGLTHGNANLMAHRVRELQAGGPAPEDELLEAQYRGAKAELFPIYQQLAVTAAAIGPDVSCIVQKTGVSFRRKKQFALIQAPSSKRIQLGLNLAETPDDKRVKEASGMCSHRVDITALEQLDTDVEGWIRASYDNAG